MENNENRIRIILNQKYKGMNVMKLIKEAFEKGQGILRLIPFVFASPDHQCCLEIEVAPL